MRTKSQGGWEMLGKYGYAQDGYDFTDRSRHVRKFQFYDIITIPCWPNGFYYICKQFFN